MSDSKKNEDSSIATGNPIVSMTRISLEVYTLPQIRTQRSQHLDFGFVRDRPEESAELMWASLQKTVSYAVCAQFFKQKFLQDL